MKKRYYNSTTHEWYTEGQSMTRRVDNGVFSGIPNVEQLYEWGFRELVEPALTPEQMLERAKQEKIAELEIYDNSLEINGFDIILDEQIVTAWLTPEQRANYKNSLDSAELLGMDVVHPVINGMTFELQVATAKMYLAQIQIYADKCYGTTETHKANINTLETVEEVNAYEFTIDYPKRLTFEID